MCACARMRVHVCVQTTGHLNKHIYVLTWEVVIWVYKQIKKILNCDLCIFQYVSYTPVDKTQWTNVRKNEVYNTERLSFTLS